MTVEQIIELERLLQQSSVTSPAPWENNPKYAEIEDLAGDIVVGTYFSSSPTEELIVAMRNALPDLLKLAREAAERDDP